MIRATMIFNYANAVGRAAGWSESWYLGSDLSDPNIANTFAFIMQMRAAMLPVGVDIIGQRYTQINNAAFSPGNATKSLSANVIVPGAYNNHGAGALKDIPQMAIQCRVQGSAVNNVKNYDIRAIPDGLVVGGAFVPDQLFTNAFLNFANRLRIDSWLFRAIDLTEPKIGIASIAADGTYTLLANSAVAVGQYFTMLRVKDQNGKAVTGTYFVQTVTTPTTGKLLAWKGQTVGQSGSVRRRNFIYPSMAPNTNQIIRATTRKVGRPFNPYRGRVTARR